ncbi:phosphatase PAP2 family protein [Segetibacter koreensis]|uniref:phosphatase PAP2 family protein n=1 Tax=Segetibacter koreensis TaxID=398037 RepID=UPI0003821322|nr:phosphatase PAP2 family protein [Segetibacter koreensis]
MFKKIAILLLIIIHYSVVRSQATNDSINKDKKITRINDEMVYNVGNGKSLVYTKPRQFGFIRNLPGDAAGIASAAFKKESVKPWLLIAGSTGLLLLCDQAIADGVIQFSDNIHLHAEEKNKNLLNFKMGGKDVSLFRLPANVNTALYQVGQGFPSLLIGAGLYTYGKINKDYRALSTASQLAEAFILMGVSTQIVKRVTGRQSPSETTTPGGKWNFLPSFSQYQNHTPNFDAFPSGHLATLMSSVTIFSENYPEKKWIKPVGYSITGLVGYAMINNKVHWASDYPLALAMGYLCAKQVVKRNRQVVGSAATAKKRGELTYTFNYLNGAVMPGIIYKF